MKQKRVLALFLLMSLLFTGCSQSGDNGTVQESEQTKQGDIDMETETTTDIVTTLSKIDNSKWQYNEEDGVYWQVGISYCENPADEKYETLGIFVPLALENYGREVDFETVWGSGHTMAERTGNSTENFIAWVNECLK
jgi:hypothetical protein